MKRSWIFRSHRPMGAVICSSWACGSLAQAVAEAMHGHRISTVLCAVVAGIFLPLAFLYAYQTALEVEAARSDTKPARE
ncbi:MAG: hypothetical protein QM820_43145 [Minicystis sp.]